MFRCVRYQTLCLKNWRNKFSHHCLWAVKNITMLMVKFHLIDTFFSQAFIHWFHFVDWSVNFPSKLSCIRYTNCKTFDSSNVTLDYINLNFTPMPYEAKLNSIYAFNGLLFYVAKIKPSLHLKTSNHQCSVAVNLLRQVSNLDRQYLKPQYRLLRSQS